MASGQDAVERIAHIKPDLVLMDIVRDIPIKDENGKMVGRVFVFAVRDTTAVEHIE